MGREYRRVPTIAISVVKYRESRQIRRVPLMATHKAWTLLPGQNFRSALTAWIESAWLRVRMRVRECGRGRCWGEWWDRNTRNAYNTDTSCKCLHLDSIMRNLRMAVPHRQLCRFRHAYMVVADFWFLFCSSRCWSWRLTFVQEDLHAFLRAGDAQHASTRLVEHVPGLGRMITRLHIVRRTPPTIE